MVANVVYEFVWLCATAGSSTDILAREMTVWDMINTMKKSNYPIPLVTKMKMCLETNDSFCYLNGNYQVHKVLHNNTPNAKEIESLRINKVSKWNVQVLTKLGAKALEYSKGDPGFIDGK